jgi:hypothetical protein
MAPDGSRARTTTRIVAGAGLGVLLVALAVVVAPALDADEQAAPAAPPTTEAPATPAPRVVVVRVPLTVAGTFDPEGDGTENDAAAALAVDGDPTTAWSSERYASFFKDGVGLVLDAGAVRRLQRLDVVTGGSGVTAAVRVGDRPAGPFRPAAAARPLDATTRFSLAGKRGRYVLVWITAIPDGGAAELAEVRLRARR